MKTKILRCSVLMLPAFFAFSSLFAQVNVTVNINQPSPLVSNAGEDKTIPEGGSTSIGGTTTGGTGAYSYAWSPATGLSGTTIANPNASPSETTTYYLTVNDANNCSSTDSMVVYIGPMGIDPSSGAGLFSISPNPGNGLFSLTLPAIAGNNPLSLEIYDPLGKLVYSRSFTNEKARPVISVDLSGMAKGAYLVKLACEKTVFSNKLVLK